jgi:hypothetical protein
MTMTDPMLCDHDYGEERDLKRCQKCGTENRAED